MRWLIRIVLILVALAVMAWVIGAALPEAHVAAVRADIPASPGDVHRRITDVAAGTSWRTGLDDVTVLSSDPPRWRESGEYGAIEYVREVDRPDLVVARIAGDRSDFGGVWSYRIEPLGDEATRLTIVEEGEVYSPLFRFFSRFVFGHHGAMEAYLRDLGASFGEEVDPERIEPGD